MKKDNSPLEPQIEYPDMNNEDGKGLQPTSYLSISSGSQKQIAGEVVDEVLACISVNGVELATFMCSPHRLDLLAVGFLYNEGFIDHFEEVRSVHISKNETCVDVWLHESDFKVPSRRIVTAGCGGGVTFDDLSEKHEPLISDLTVDRGYLVELMRKMHIGAELYQRARGIHTAALGEHDEILLQVEDVGRHNCLDRLAGDALIANLETRDRVLLSSGRISSEMINKARRLQTPIVCSRTSPTSLSIALAEAWDMTIIAYLRQNRMRLHTHPGRII